MKKTAIYMDYAAATPVDSEIVKAMKPYLSDLFYNPSAVYLASKSVKKDLEAARASVAKTIGARPSEVVFTAGGTEANNLAIAGIMRMQKGGNVIISAVEHDSVLEIASQFDSKKAPVDKFGVVDINKLARLIDNETVLISIMLVNNEIGTIEPIKEVVKLVEKVRVERTKQGIKKPLYLHTDACQAANFLDVHVSRLGVDLMSINAGKLYGPKQAGVLYVRGGISLSPIIFGGGQESSLRSGTENTGACIGLAQALAKAQKKRNGETKRLAHLQKLFFDLLAEKIPRATINGPLRRRCPNNVHITLEGFDSERLLMELDERGIMCSTGSACSASNDELSHVLKGIGLSDEQAQSSLRFTMGRKTTEADVRFVVDTLQNLVLK